MAYTYDELIKMGAKPVETQPQGKSYTYDELVKMGAKPTTAPAQPTQPQQDPNTGRLIGVVKSYARPVVSALQNTAKIIGGSGAIASVPSQEREQKQLAGQYEGLLQQALKEKDPTKRQGLLAQARATQGQIGSAGTVSRFAEGIYETPSLDRAQEALQYKTPYEKQGGFVGDVSKYFIPSAGVEKGVSAVSKLLPSTATPFVKGATEIATRAIGEGASGSLIKAADIGTSNYTKEKAKENLKTISNTFKTGAIASGITQVALKTIAGALKGMGGSIQMKSLKPSAKELSEFKARNPKEATQIFNQTLDKYDLGGSISDTIEKSAKILEEKRKTLKSILQSSDEVLDVNNALDETGSMLWDDISKNPDLTGEIQKSYNTMISDTKASLIKNQLEDIWEKASQGVKMKLGKTTSQIFKKATQYDNVDDFIKAEGVKIMKDSKLMNELIKYQNPNLDLSLANRVKIAAGTGGSWANGVPNKDAKASEIVYNRFYDILKNKIEQLSGSPQVQQLNKEMSEIIPVMKVAIKRLPVAQRQNVIGLTDSMSIIGSLASGSLAPLALAGARAITGSAKAGNIIKKTGMALSPMSKPVGQVVPKLFFPNIK